MTAAALQGRRLLVVEDEYHLAMEFGRQFEMLGAEVVGPVGDISGAFRLLAGEGRIDGAVLDVNLYGQTVFPVAYELRRRGVPFLFATGFDDLALPPDLADVPVLRKPVDLAQVLEALKLPPESRRGAIVRGLADALKPAPRPTTDNAILAALPQQSLSDLIHHATMVELRAGELLTDAEARIGAVHFLLRGVVSVDTVMPRGEHVSTAVIGREGLTGLSLAFGVDTAPQRTTVRVAGEAWRLPAEAFQSRLATDAHLRRAVLTYAHTVQVQTASAAVAAARFTLDGRLARLLLLCHDRLDGDDLPLRHADLSEMLGTRRSGVTNAIHILEGDGILKATRGHIRVVDRTRLAEAAGGA